MMEAISGIMESQSLLHLGTLSVLCTVEYGVSRLYCCMFFEVQLYLVSIVVQWSVGRSRLYVEEVRRAVVKSRVGLLFFNTFD